MKGRFEVPVRLFGRHREAAGEPVLPVELADGATVADLKTALAQHPAFGTSLDGAAVAVNRTYRSDESLVVEGDEVAIIPPVAGG
ncbi:MAG: MoaD/ThiS family protein [Gemmatimonadetes bacterium]|nr:MoaD/ThiS family protein [Gemmatimonadota bacterium]MBT8478859.1 MoaD/ThiS family protein [Gemmatimonadota bacterium]NNK48860.1 MoaD/ThiS family protein [Gemmatimonadota bacterium]